MDFLILKFMESKIFKFIFIMVILFAGVSLGNKNENDLQSKLDKFEIEIQEPYNDYSNHYVEVYDANLMNNVAKKTENLLMSSIDAFGEVVNSIFGTLFG